METNISGNAYEQAKAMYAQGKDNKYIELQLAEERIADDVIEGIIQKINALRKSERRASGRKLLFYGVSFLVLGIIATVISFNSDSPVRFVLWGILLTGVALTAKGLANIIGL